MITPMSRKVKKARRDLLALVDALDSAEAIEANAAAIVRAAKAIKELETAENSAPIDMFASQPASDFAAWQEEFGRPSLFSVLKKEKRS